MKDEFKKFYKNLKPVTSEEVNKVAKVFDGDIMNKMMEEVRMEMYKRNPREEVDPRLFEAPIRKALEPLEIELRIQSDMSLDEAVDIMFRSMALSFKQHVDSRTKDGIDGLFNRMPMKMYIWTLPDMLSDNPEPEFLGIGEMVDIVTVYLYKDKGTPEPTSQELTDLLSNSNPEIPIPANKIPGDKELYKLSNMPKFKVGEDKKTYYAYQIDFTEIGALLSAFDRQLDKQLKS